MTETLELREMAIVIATQSYNPTILTSDFLKYSGIVPTTWEVAQTPILASTASQVTFQNGVNILAQPNRLVFSEIATNKRPEELSIAKIARTYVRMQSQVNYQAVGTLFKGYVLFDQEQQAHDYLFRTLLVNGPWQMVGKTPPQASVRLTYALEQALLSLDISEVKLKLPEQADLPGILFTANFNYDIPGETPNDRMPCLSQLIGNWQDDLNLYKDIVNTRFLSPKTNGSVSATPKNSSSTLSLV